MSSPLTGHMSRFALLCQAARLLGQVIHHLSLDSAVRDDGWIQLDRTLQSMIAASLNVDSPDYDQISFIYRYMVFSFSHALLTAFNRSALVALYTPWLYSDGVNMVDRDRSQRAKLVIQQITETISTQLVDHQCFLGRDPEDMSPWGLFFAYHVCGFHVQSSRAASAEPGIVKSLKEAFLAIDVRWNVAGTSCRL